MQVAFMTFLFGGAEAWTGRDVFSVHHHMVEHGVGPAEFERMVQVGGHVYCQPGCEPVGHCQWALGCSSKGHTCVRHVAVAVGSPGRAHARAVASRPHSRPVLLMCQHCTTSISL